MTTTTYRCTACGQDVEIEEIEIANAVNVIKVIEIKPCETCIRVALEEASEGSFDEGYQEGWQACFDSSSKETEDVAKEGEAKASSWQEGFDAGLINAKKPDTKDNVLY